MPRRGRDGQRRQADDRRIGQRHGDVRTRQPQRAIQTADRK